LVELYQERHGKFRPVSKGCTHKYVSKKVAFILPNKCIRRQITTGNTYVGKGKFTCQ